MGGPTTLPRVPSSVVPRAKRKVRARQPVLAEMSVAVEPPV